MPPPPSLDPSRRALRRRLAAVARDPDADLAEAAALVASEAGPPDPALVTRTLLRVDALTDQLRIAGVTPVDAAHDAAALREALGVERGFRGHDDGGRVPADGLLDHVLDRRRGLPITLSILYVAVARRLRVRAYPIALPGHVVVGIVDPTGPTDRPVVIDPFHGGATMDEGAVAALVGRATSGQLTFHRAMLRPADTGGLVRRLLNNLTHDYSAQGQLRDALWTVECKQVVPGAVADDDRVRGRLLEQLGRFDEAADAYEAYVRRAPDDAPDRDEVRRDAVRSRARTN